MCPDKRDAHRLYVSQLKELAMRDAVETYAELEKVKNAVIDVKHALETSPSPAIAVEAAMKIILKLISSDSRGQNESI